MTKRICGFPPLDTQGGGYNGWKLFLVMGRS